MTVEMYVEGLLVKNPVILCDKSPKETRKRRNAFQDKGDP